MPEEVAAAYGGKAHSFGPDYIIPAPFDPRLMEVVPAAVAQAAMDAASRSKPIEDMDAYRTALRARLNPTTSVLTLAYEAARANPTPRALRRGRGGCRAARRDRRSATAATASRCWSAATTSTTGCGRSASTIPQSFEVHNSRN